VMGEEAALERLFLSVLDNAVKYTPAGGQVSLGFRLANGRAVIEIADSGIGIEAKDLPHVFERFYRADQVRSRETRGSGLGLAIAKWIVERHAGSIALQSEAGQGTRVTINIPLSEELETQFGNLDESREIPTSLIQSSRT
jgi:signal transduction histidine kinase